MTVEYMTRDLPDATSGRGSRQAASSHVDVESMIKHQVEERVAAEMASLKMKGDANPGDPGIPRKMGVVGAVKDVVRAGGALKAAAEEGERKVAERMAKINGGSAPEGTLRAGTVREATRSAPVVTRPDLGIASDDPEEAFLKSTAPLPKSLYGRLNQLSALPGFPASPPLVLSAHGPKAYMFRNFLTTQECEHLMTLAKKQLAPSTVVGDKGKGSQVSTIRTSAGMFLSKGQDPTVRLIEERIAAAAGIPEPNGEGLQILRYENGQKYDPHYDYFHDQVNSAPRRGGQRMATMLIYLEDTEQGGETIFPNGERPEHWDADEPGNHNEWSECAKKGIPVKSHRGDAVLFWSLKEDYTLDSGSLHGACPVISGEKWTAVKWIRVAKFDGGFKDKVPMPPLARSDRSKGQCLDEWSECGEWAKKGWCDRNPSFMTGLEGARDSKGPACPQSCDASCV